MQKKNRETNESECRHVNTFVTQVFEQVCTFYHFHPFSPFTVLVHCRLWNVEGGRVPIVESEESGVLSVECKVRSVKCEV